MRISDWSSDVCSSDLVAGQDHVELVLLFSGRSGSANSGRSSSNGSSGRTAPLFFEQLRKIRSFQNGQRRQVVNDLCKISHFHTPSNFNRRPREGRSEEHTSELPSLMRISYAVFCLKKTNNKLNHTTS